MLLIRRIFFLFIIVVFVCSCDDKFQTIQTYEITARNNKPGSGDSIMRDSSGHFFFSRLRGQGMGGLSIYYPVKEEHQNKELWVVFSGRIRTDYPHSNSSITISAASSATEIVVWRAVLLRYYYTDMNKWCPFKDSVFLKATTNNKKYVSLNVFAYSGESKTECFDIDTLKVQIKEKI